MEIKDTLSIYDDLIAGGCTESQARVQAHQLGAFRDFAGDITSLVEKIEKNMWWMRAIGAGMIIACFGVMFK